MSTHPASKESLHQSRAYITRLPPRQHLYIFDKPLLSEGYFIFKNSFSTPSSAVHIPIQQYHPVTTYVQDTSYISKMSSNVPTNEQNAAVNAGSDTDSIASLSSQAANMSLDRSSSPALPSSEASDEEGEITIVKDDSLNEEEGTDEEGQMPFLDKYGQVSLPVENVFSPLLSLYTYPQIHHLFFLAYLFFVLDFVYLYSLSHVSCAGEVFPCPLSSLKWFQSCVAMKLRPVSPIFPSYQLTMFFSLPGIFPNTFMSVYYCTSPVGQFFQFVPYIPWKRCVWLLFHSPCWPSWSTRPIFIGRVVPVYYTTFSQWRNRRMFSVVIRIVLLVNSPHDAANDVADKSSQKYLNPPSPQPFQTFSPFSTSTIYLSSHLSRPI